MGTMEENYPDGGWQSGDRVLVSLPNGLPGSGLKAVHAATVERTRPIGPSQANPQRTVKVRFDDEHIFGGLGTAWVNPNVVVREDEEPADAEWPVVSE
jgi:hypothetical protein